MEQESPPTEALLWTWFFNVEDHREVLENMDNPEVLRVFEFDPLGGDKKPKQKDIIGIVKDGDHILICMSDIDKRYWYFSLEAFKELSQKINQITQDLSLIV